jgi:hypothetical protein
MFGFEILIKNLAQVAHLQMGLQHQPLDFTYSNIFGRNLKQNQANNDDGKTLLTSHGTKQVHCLKVDLKFHY